MGRLAIKAKTPKEVAQIMSEQTGCDVFEKDVRIEVSRTTTLICSAIVPDKVNGVVKGKRHIMYFMGVSNRQGEVTSQKLW